VGTGQGSSSRSLDGGAQRAYSAEPSGKHQRIGYDDFDGQVIITAKHTTVKRHRHNPLGRKDFSSEGWVRFVRNTAGFETCVPCDLPPDLRFDGTLIGALSTADRALGQLNGIIRALPNPRLLVRSFVRREAVLSSRIEGTAASLSDLYLFEMNPEREQHTPDVREVSNYVRALDHGIERLKYAPFSLAVVKELHAILLEGVRGSDKSPGAFRKTQNFISPTERIQDASYIPPPHEHLIERLEKLEDFANGPSELPLLVRLALIHYQFEAIHPFEDGNGRVGRLLISILLERERALPHPVLYLSAYFEKHQRAYYDLLLKVSQTGDWNAWIAFFVRGVADQSVDAVERSQALFALRDRWTARCQKARARALLLKLIDMLFVSPYVDAAHAEQQLEVRHQSAQKKIDQLVTERILEEITGQRRNRVYAAREIVRILEETPALDEPGPEPIT
jgi:Fic family protein